MRFDATESSGGFASSIMLRRWFDNGVQFGTDPVITIVISPGEHTIRLEVENDAGNQHARELTGLIAG